MKKLLLMYLRKIIISFFLLTIFFSISTWSQTAVAPPGSGTDADPCRVSTVEHLYYMSLHSTGNMFVQVADIDASATRYWDGGKGFLPISTLHHFQGGYNGNGYIIKNLYINRPEADNIGLFGNMYGYGSLKNIGLVNAEITGRNNVGGIVGSVSFFQNIISGCFVTGKITGASGVGGLIGSASESQINFCYSNCTVKGSMFNTGGLIGTNYSSKIYNCYALGNVTGKYSTGGFVGDNFSGSSTQPAIISSCYFSGTVNSTDASSAGALVGFNYALSIVSNSYWDKDMAGDKGVGSNLGSFSGTGLTTDQMKQPTIFTGWDFTSAWKIRAGKTFPALPNVADNAPFAFPDIISKHSGIFEILSLLANDYDYESLQNNLVLKIEKLSAGHHDFYHIYVPASAKMGDTLRIHYKVGIARTAHNDTLWGNSVTSLLIYSNQAPVIGGLSSYIIPEDSQLDLSLDEITATDPDNDPVTIHLFEGDDYQISGTTITPDLNYSGILHVGVGATDGFLMSDTSFLEITVTNVNDAPEFIEVPDKTMPEDSAICLSINDLVYNDPDMDVSSLIIGEGNNYIINADTIRPIHNFNGNLNIPLRLTDGMDTSQTVMMHITVNPVNDAPELLSTAPLYGFENTEYLYQVLVSDVDEQELTYSLVWRPAEMTISAGGIIRWIPPPGLSTSGQVTVKVSDGESESFQTFTISVLPPNLIPVAKDTSVVILENEQINVRLYATDPDGTINAIMIGTDPLHGTAVRSGLTITYIPDGNFSGKDSLIWYAIDDNMALSEPATLTISITDVNYVPEIVSSASVHANAGEIYTYDIVATDRDDDSLTYSIFNQPEGMMIDEHGMISWTPEAGVYTSGPILVVVSDGKMIDTEIFTIEVSQPTSSTGILNTRSAIYPNPCKDHFTINAGEELTLLSIYDLNGRVVLTQQVQGLNVVNIEFLPNGTYIINLNGASIKLVKSH